MSNECNDLWDVSLHDLRAVYDPAALLKLRTRFQRALCPEHYDVNRVLADSNVVVLAMQALA